MQKNVTALRLSTWLDLAHLSKPTECGSSRPLEERLPSFSYLPNMDSFHFTRPHQETTLCHLILTWICCLSGSTHSRMPFQVYLVFCRLLPLDNYLHFRATMVELATLCNALTNLTISWKTTMGQMTVLLVYGTGFHTHKAFLPIRSLNCV